MNKRFALAPLSAALLATAILAASCDGLLSRPAIAAHAGKGTLLVTVPAVHPALSPEGSAGSRAFGFASRVDIALYPSDNPDSPIEGGWSFVPDYQAGGKYDSSRGGVNGYRIEVPSGSGYALSVKVYNSTVSSTEPTAVGRVEDLVIEEYEITPVSVTCAPTSSTPLVFGSSAEFALTPTLESDTEFLIGTEAWYKIGGIGGWVELKAENLSWSAEDDSGFAVAAPAGSVRGMIEGPSISPTAGIFVAVFSNDGAALGDPWNPKRISVREAEGSLYLLTEAGASYYLCAVAYGDEQQNPVDVRLSYQAVPGPAPAPVLTGANEAVIVDWSASGTGLPARIKYWKEGTDESTAIVEKEDPSGYNPGNWISGKTSFALTKLGYGDGYNVRMQYKYGDWIRESEVATVAAIGEAPALLSPSPAGTWKAVDLGYAEVPGTAAYDEATDTLGIISTAPLFYGGTSDAGCFVYTQASGNFDITVKMPNQGPQAVDSATGVTRALLVRTGLSSGARSAQIIMSDRPGTDLFYNPETSVNDQLPSMDIAMGSRENDGEALALGGTSMRITTDDAYLKLTRSRGVVMGYYSSDGIAWIAHFMNFIDPANPYIQGNGPYLYDGDVLVGILGRSGGEALDIGIEVLDYSTLASSTSLTCEEQDLYPSTPDGYMDTFRLSWTAVAGAEAYAVYAYAANGRASSDADFRIGIPLKIADIPDGATTSFDITRNEHQLFSQGYYDDQADQVVIKVVPVIGGAERNYWMEDGVEVNCSNN
ncbi:MAG TPA: hypothetical protein DIC34_18990 [Treponema sp.]|nr:MAG: hypothetical protein A2001_11995 [Treponema sp. GWC1_61_84]HCM28587.1 hypothetical protein [Treponema sp.]